MQTKLNCRSCSKVNLSKDEIGLNKKLFSEKIKEFYCLDCLAEYLDVNKDDLLIKIEEYKEAGCTAF